MGGLPTPQAPLPPAIHEETHLTEIAPEPDFYVLVDIDDMTARMEWTMDDDETRLAVGTLEDLSEDARHYGSKAWTTPENTPRQIQSLIRRTTIRHLRNPDGFTVSRAGDETVGWSDKGDSNGRVEFSDKDIKTIRQIGGARAFLTVPIYAWNSGTPVIQGLVPDAAGGDPFPMYSHNTEPW